MKKQTTLLLFLLSLITLTACSTATNSGGEASITNRTTIYEYKLSDATKLQIENKKKKIIITETLNNPFADRPSSAATNISNLIASVNNKMEAEGYTIISSDVAFMEGYTDDVKLGEVITLIFERETKEQANN